MTAGPRGRGLFASFGAIVLCFVLSAPALGQPGGNYPPPAPSSCAQTGARKPNGNFRRQEEFSPGDRMLVRGRNRCARADARVRVSIDEDAAIIGEGRANDKGGYLIGARIPETTTYGTHTIIVRTSGFSYEAQIEVVPEGGSQGAGFGATAAPMLAAWIALAALAAAFLMASRRRKPPALAAVTEHSEVPRLDTSSFVPRKAAGNGATRDRKAASSKPKTERRKPSSPARSAPKTTARKDKPAVEPEPNPASSRELKSQPSATTKRSEPDVQRRPSGSAPTKQGRKHSGS